MIFIMKKSLKKAEGLKKLYYTFLMEYQYICRYILYVSTYTEKYCIEMHQNVIIVISG